MNFKYIFPNKLSLLGYYYNKSNPVKGGHYLRCEDRKNCKAGITIVDDKIRRIGREDVSHKSEEELKAMIISSHTHEAVEDIVENTRERIAAMKMRVTCEPSKCPSEIFDEEKKRMEQKYKDVALVAEHLPQFEEMRSTLYKHKAKFYPTIPHTMKDLNFQLKTVEPLHVTKNSRI